MTRQSLHEYTVNFGKVLSFFWKFMKNNSAGAGGRHTPFRSLAKPSVGSEMESTMPGMVVGKAALASPPLHVVPFYGN